MNLHTPSLDAARHYVARDDAAIAAAREAAEDVAASRSTVAALNSIRAIDFSPAVAAQICAVLSSRIAGASWGHFPEAIDAVDMLDGAHDTLGEAVSSAS
jgi:cobalamin biosynthesis protein CbiD